MKHLISILIFLGFTSTASAECIKGDCVDGFGTYMYDSGNKYVGEFKNGKRDGQGTKTYVNGGKYVGEFKNGKRDGQGKYTSPDGGKYVGEWANGMMDGQGTKTYVNGGKYVGEFKNAKEDGQGTHTYVNGDKYVGEFKNGRSNGQGTQFFAKGGKYIGEFKNDIPHGYGKLNYPNFLYIGEFKNGKQDGQGTSIFKESGSTYIGEWKNGKHDGEGTFLFSNGNKYVGSFKNHKLHGKGIITYNSGVSRSTKFEFNKCIEGCANELNSSSTSNVDWGAIIQFGFGMMNGSIGNNSISSGSDSFDNIDSTFNSTSNAACACKCVNGKVKAICSNPNDLPPLCAPKLCPLVNQSIKPLDSPTLPPYGTSNCTNMQVYNPSTYQYEWEEICY